MYSFTMMDNEDGERDAKKEVAEGCGAGDEDTSEEEDDVASAEIMWL